MGKDCEWGQPRAPAVRLLWDVRAVDAAVEFLESTRVGCRTATRVLGPRKGESQASGDEGGAGPPQAVSFLCFFPLSIYLFSFVLSFVWRNGEQETGVP